MYEYNGLSILIRRLINLNQYSIRFIIVKCKKLFNQTIPTGLKINKLVSWCSEIESAIILFIIILYNFYLNIG